MRSHRFPALLVAAVLSLPVPAAAGQTFALSEVFPIAWPTPQPKAPWGSPYSPYLSIPGNPMAAALSHGFAVTSFGTTEHRDAVVDGKLVDLSGQPGPGFFGEFVANESDAWIRDPAIAATGPGGFVLAWIENPWRIYFRLFRPGAAPLDGSVLEGDSEARCSAAVAGNAAGRFVVAWEDFSSTYVAARAFDPAGAPASGELAVPKPQTLLDGGNMPRVGMDAAGRFVVLWRQAGATAEAPARLCGQSYGVRGGFLGATFCVGDLAGGTGGALAVDPAGTFLAAWFGPARAGKPVPLFVRRYQMNGTPLGQPIQVGSGVDPSQLTASGDGHGNAALSWQQGDRLFVLPVRRNGVASSPTIAISGVTRHPSNYGDVVYANGVALADSGRLLVTWSSGDRILGQFWQAGF